MASSFLDNSLGTMFIGLLLATSLWGASNLQLVRYFRLRFHDDHFVKILVVGVWLVDTVHQVLVAQSLYLYLVTDFGEFTDLERPSRPFALQYIFQGITTFAVQSFYAYRIWMLRRKHPLLPALVAPFIAGSFALIIYVGQSQLQSPNFVRVNGDFGVFFAVYAGATFVIDLLIAGFLYRSLRADKSDWSSTQSVIDQLVAYCVGTGAVTSLCAFATLLAKLLAPSSFIFLIFFMASVYTNSMLASLNARKALRRMQAAPHSEPLVFLRSLASDSAHQHEARFDQEAGTRGSQVTIYDANPVRK